MPLALSFAVARGAGDAAENWRRLLLPEIRGSPHNSIKIGGIIANELTLPLHIPSKLPYCSFFKMPFSLGKNGGSDKLKQIILVTPGARVNL